MFVLPIFTPSEAGTLSRGGILLSPGEAALSRSAEEGAEPLDPGGYEFYA